MDWTVNHMDREPSGVGTKKAEPVGGIVVSVSIMGVVLMGGVVRSGDSIRIELPSEPHRPLERM
jgi:hypothetical protein